VASVEALRIDCGSRGFPRFRAIPRAGPTPSLLVSQTFIGLTGALMNRTLKLIISLTALLALLGGVALLWGRDSKPREREYRVKVAEAAPERRLSRPAELARAAQPLPAAKLPAEPEAPAREPARDTEPVAPEPEDQVAHVDTLYAAQPVDRNWAAVAVRKLDDGLRRYFGERSRMMQVDCRTSLCKVSVSHQDIAVQMAFVKQAFSVSDYWPGARMAWRRQNPDGTVTSELYFVKDGEPLPQLN
jgi:hypothetical protein